MKIQIQELLKELMSYTVIRTNTISAQAKNALYEMRAEFVRVKSSEDADKQSKMISLFIGGTLFALHLDAVKYGYHGKLYSASTVSDANKKIKEETPSSAERMYATGQEALLHLPQAFNSDLFKNKVKLINSDKPIPFFPELEDHADKVDLLVKCCLKYRDNLNASDMEIDESDLIDLPKDTNITPAATVHQNTTSKTSKANFNISMQVLGGFIAAVGCAAVATAFILLNAASLGTVGLVVAGLGAAAILAGVGLFATHSPKPEPANEPLAELSLA